MSTALLSNESTFVEELEHKSVASRSNSSSSRRHNKSANNNAHLDKSNSIVSLDQGIKKPTVALRLLEPSSKKLTNLETQRIVSVFESAVKYVEIITGLPSALTRIEELSTVFTRQLVSLMQSYRAMKMEFDMHSAKRDALENRRQNRRQEMETFQKEETLLRADFWTTNAKQSSSLSAGKDGEAEMKPDEFGVVHYEFTDSQIQHFVSKKKDIEKDYELSHNKVIHAAKAILQAFKTNPSAMEVLTSSEKDWKIKRGPGDCNLIQQMRKMKDVITLKMRSNPLEEQERNSRLRRTNEKNTANMAQIKELEEHLATLTKNKDDKMSEKVEIKTKLQTEIMTIDKITEETKKRTRSEMERQLENDDKNSESTCQKLNVELTQRRAEYQEKRKVGMNSEKEMRSQKYKLETELESELAKYDSDMTERQSRFESEEAEFNEQKEQLEELEERFKALEEEYLAIKEEQRIAEEKREAEHREQESLVRAVLTIQSFWRSFKTRKGKRGGKKGGKKKKK